MEEQDRQPNVYEQVRERIVNALVQTVLQDFKGKELLFTLDSIDSDIDGLRESLHKETVRALCYYAAVAAGEITETAIGYIPERNPWVEGKGSRYKDGEQVILNEFIVVPRAEPREIKRTVTYEPVTEYDTRRRKQRARAKDESQDDPDIIRIQPTDNQRNRRRTQIPGFVSNIVNNRRSF